MSNKVIMYSTGACPYCVRARMMFEGKGIEFTDMRVDQQPSLRAEMQQRSGRHTVPQIWIGEYHVGGYDDMWMLDRQGRLDPLLDGV